MRSFVMIRKRLPALLTEDGLPTRHAMQRYTHGECDILAFQAAIIAAEAGNPLPLTAAVYVDEAADVSLTTGWYHVAVDLGRERLLDVTGVHTRQVFTDRWSTLTGEPVTTREMGRFHAFTDLLNALDVVPDAWTVSIEEESDAREVAEALIRFYL